VNKQASFNLPGWTSFGLVLLLWELTARAVPEYRLYLPPISEVLGALAGALFAGPMAGHLAITLQRFVAGYFLAAALGVGLGVALGYFPALQRLFGTTIEFLRPMPSVAIIPVAILLLGIGDAMIVAVTVYASVWPILINTIDGVRNIESTLVATGRTFGLGLRAILWRIIFPAASPYVVTGLRIALSIALILVTTAEMVAGSKGLGFFILDEERSMNSHNMYAGILVVAACGYTLNRLFLRLEGRAMRWRHGMIRQEIA
jgi:NitT/TauT family transport system permease protein/sulfonate transport system permease protein